MFASCFCNFSTFPMNKLTHKLVREYDVKKTTINSKMTDEKIGSIGGKSQKRIGGLLVAPNNFTL